MSDGAIPGLGALNRLAPRERLALAMLVPIAGIVLAVRLFLPALSDAQDRLATERRALAGELELLESAELLPKHIEEALRKTEAADLRLLEATSVILAEAKLTELLESWASRSRVLLREIQSVAPPRGEEPPPGTETLRLSVMGESDLEGVLTFLDTLESGLLLVRVRGLALEPVLARPETDEGPQGEPVPTGVVEFQLIVESYVKTNVTGAESRPES